MFKFLSFIEVNYTLFNSPANVLGHCMVMKYAGKTYNGTLTLNNPTQWMNVNLRV